MIKITLTDNAAQILGQIKSLEEHGIGAAICEALDNENAVTVGHVRNDYLKGPRPEKLGVRSDRLWKSIRRNDASADGNTITSSIGTNVEYAAIHEFGGTIRRVQLAGSVRLRTDAKGNLIRNERGGAVFASKKHKRAQNAPYAGGKRFDIVMPARPYLRPAIQDRVPFYEKRISAAIVAAWEARGQS